MTRHYYVYCLFCESNIPFYIGMTCSPESRLLSHMVRFGKKIKMELLHSNILQKEVAQKKEKAAIRKHILKGFVLVNIHDAKLEKRVGKSYKVSPEIYNQSVARATENNTTVANVVEDFLGKYIEFDPVIFFHAKK